MISWRASQENTKFYSQAQQVHRQDDSFTSRARFSGPSLGSSRSGSRSSSALVRSGSGFSPGPACMSGSVSSPVASESRSATYNFGDLDSLWNFSLDLDNEAALREKQACSEVLDRVAEFCKLDRQDTEAKKEIMGMRLPVYNAPAKKSIELSLLWNNSTILMRSLGGPKEFIMGSAYYNHNTEGYVPKPESLIIPSRE